MEEIWKVIPNSEGKYFASNYGKIKSFKESPDGIIVGDKNAKAGRGTLYKMCSINGKSMYVHRLIALTFIPNPENKPEVGHKDNISTNNIADNLEWVTHSENQLNSSIELSMAKRGEKHPKSLLSDADALKVMQLRKQKVRYKEIAKIFNIKENTLCGIVTRYYSHLKDIS